MTILKDFTDGGPSQRQLNISFALEESRHPGKSKGKRKGKTEIPNVRRGQHKLSTAINEEIPLLESRNLPEESKKS